MAAAPPTAVGPPSSGAGLGAMSSAAMGNVSVAATAPGGIQQLTYKLNGVVATALSASPDGSLAVLAGRDVLQILQVGTDSITMTQNLRTGRVNMSYSCNDVKWCPIMAAKNTIATAATNGAIAVWDVSSLNNKQVRMINDAHQRAVHRVCFNPANPALLLSASQDGLLRLWDLRAANASLTFEGKAESARDAQFNPMEPNTFAAVFETGVVQRWDIRVPDKIDKRINAHSGPVFTLDWHPEGRYLASGSRDKSIKVWDMRQADLKRANVHSIHTIAAVGHVQWRPGYRNQLASIALLTDRRIHVWDLRRKYVPEMTLDDHTEVTLGMLWRGSDCLWSCSKDQTFMQHQMSDAYQLSRLQTQSAVSFSPTGELAFAHLSQATRNSLNAADGSDPSSFSSLSIFAKPKPPLKLRLPERERDKLPADGRLLVNQVVPKQILAVAHATASFDHMVAEYHQAHSALAQTWKILELLSAATTSPLDGSMRGSEALEPDPSLSSGLSITSTEQSSSVATRSRDKLSSKNSQSLPSLIISPDTSATDNVEETLVVSPSSSDDEAEFLHPVPSLQSTTVRSERSSRSPAVLTEVHVTPSKMPVFVEWQEKDVLMQTLEYYAEMADVQTCVSILIVLQDILKVDDKKIKLWFYAYIELLQRFKLWSVAALITAKCPLIEVRAMTQASTTINTSCSSCFKPMLQQDHGYWVCENCLKSSGPCAICRVAVRGLYVWCEGCGHGGHAQHIFDWFANWATCPAGCGHVCTALQHHTPHHNRSAPPTPTAPTPLSTTSHASNPPSPIKSSLSQTAVTTTTTTAATTPALPNFADMLML